MTSVGVVISTVSNRVEIAMRLAAELREFVADVCVIVQGCGQDGESERHGIRIVERCECGLSRSRNLGIEKCTTDYVWLLDDDVSVRSEWYHGLVEEIRKTNPDLLIGRVQCSESEQYYKSYSDWPWPIRLRVLKASSIELVLRRQFAMDLGLTFDVNLGLGSRLPSGEENCFLLSCAEKHANFRFSTRTLVAHPCEDQNRDVLSAWKTSGVAYSKGIVARKVGGALGVLTLARWIFRAMIASVPVCNLRESLRGYKDGNPVKYEGISGSG